MFLLGTVLSDAIASFSWLANWQMLDLYAGPGGNTARSCLDWEEKFFSGQACEATNCVFSCASLCLQLILHYAHRADAKVSVMYSKRDLAYDKTRHSERSAKGISWYLVICVWLCMHLGIFFYLVHCVCVRVTWVCAYMMKCQAMSWLAICLHKWALYLIRPVI